jgi:peptide/nickel transport system permease protein
MSYFDDRTDKDVFNPVHGEGDARRRSYELNDKYAGKDNTPSEENKPPEEDYSLNDDRRVKVLSPGTLVAKRFFRNRLAVVGLTILAVMFVFSFIGGLISPYGQDEVFYRDDIQLKEYAAMSKNTEYRYLVADGQEFGTILQAQLTLHMGKDDSFSYKGVTYDVTEEGDSLYSVSSGGRLLAIAYKDIISSSDPSQKFGFNFSFNALKAHANGEAEFTANGKTYTLDEDSVMLNGEEIAYISRFVIQSKVSGTVISKDFKERVQQAVENGETEYTYVNDAGQEREIKLEYNPAKYQWSIKEGTSTRVFDAYSFPDSAHWLGTDKNGMDMLTRLMYGGRVSLMIGFIVVIISAALGVVLGGVSGYFGGWVDNLIMRIVDIFYCIPSTPLIIILGAAMDGMRVDPQIRMLYLMLILGFLGWPGGPRPDPLSARAGVYDRDGGLRHQRFAPHLPPPDPQRHPAAHRQLHDEPRLHHHHRGNAQLPRPRRQVPVRLLGQHHERRFQLLRPHELLVHLDPRRHLPDADGPRLQLRRRRSARRVRPEDEALRKEGI